jgi:ATP-dependent phosphofructokinase / diphosphate-dependent phosphofructokinase
MPRAKKRIGILTSGGDCPGLNAAIRAIGKAGRERQDMELIGFINGFRGLVENKSVVLTDKRLSGILTLGGTILGTSRDKPHRMSFKGQTGDMTPRIIQTYKKNRLEGLICLGGGGTQKNALLLKKKGLHIVTLPKTIDNDIALTDVSFGFNTAVSIATEAIDRLHSTATSHSRIIVVEVMGHRAGWLALQSGLAGGADVIILPEIPYSPECVAQAIEQRTLQGKRFSIVVVAEGAVSDEDAKKMRTLVRKKKSAQSKKSKLEASKQMQEFHAKHVNHTIRLTRRLEKLTGTEARLSILGHLQRGGTPTAADRVLATRLGTRCVETIAQKKYGVMLAVRRDRIQPVPLEKVAGKKKLVPLSHPLISSARAVGICFGDETFV